MAGKEKEAGGLLAPFFPVLVVGLAAVSLALNRRANSDRIAANGPPVKGAAVKGAAALPAPSGMTTSDMATVWGPLGRFKAIVLTVYEGINAHRVLAIAAGVAFYSLLAIFPAIAALVSLYGLFANPGTIAADLQQLSGMLPEGAIEVIRDQLTRVSQQQQGALGLTFLVSLAISLWSANSGVKALIDALNIVRGEEEKRNFFALNALSLLFTTGGILFIVLALIAVVAVPVALHFLGIDQTTPKLFAALRWPVLFVPTALGLAVIYRYGPCCSRPKWHWLSFGSLFAALLWLAASYLFSWYAAQFGNYNKTYGSLGAVVGFMTWIWISVIVILLGAELDRAIAATAPKSGRTDKIGA